MGMGRRKFISLVAMGAAATRLPALADTKNIASEWVHYPCEIEYIWTSGLMYRRTVYGFKVGNWVQVPVTPEGGGYYSVKEEA